MINNIKQKFLKSILSRIFFPILLIALSSCSQFFNPKDSSTIDVAILLPITAEDATFSRQYAQMIKMGLNSNSKITMRVKVIAGICSPIAALTVSGMPTDRFTFLGFLPKTLAAKEKLFTEFKELDTTLIFFETSNRLLSSLEIAIQVLGNREACVAREMTKIFQETKLDLLTNLYDYYKLHQPRGEIVLLISGKGKFEISIKQITAELLLQLQQNNSAKTATDIIYQKYQNNVRSDVRIDGVDGPLYINKVKADRFRTNVGTSVSAKYNQMEYSAGYDVTVSNKSIGHQGSFKVKVHF